MAMNRCEDYPCCGHEMGDCDGSLYGSDESIKEYAMAHLYCDHEAGIYECEDAYSDEDEDEDDFPDYAWEADYANHSSSITGIYEAP